VPRAVEALAVPAGQGSHVCPFVPSLYSPARQLLQVVCCARGCTVPAIHAGHAVLRAVVALAVPATQGSHVSPFVPVLKVPARQSLQDVCCARGCTLPATHAGHAAVNAATLLAVPATQGVYVAFPVATLYVPTGQSVHAPGSPVRPEGQLDVHGPAPLVLLKRPAAHATHNPGVPSTRGCTGRLLYCYCN